MSAGKQMDEQANKPRPAGRHRLSYNSSVASDELEIVDVTPDPGEGVEAHFRVIKGDGLAIEIVGWVLGKTVAATEVEVLADGAVAGRTPVAVERPDVAATFPDVAEAATAGFRLELMASGRGESQLEVHAVLEDDSREPLGRIVVKAERSGLLGALRRG